MAPFDDPSPQVATQDFVRRERRRGAIFEQFNGEYRRISGLELAYLEGHIRRGALSAGWRYFRDYTTFHDIGRYPSSWEGRSTRVWDDLEEWIFTAAVQLARANRRLTSAQRYLVHVVCGLQQVVSPALMRELWWPLQLLETHYKEEWALTLASAEGSPQAIQSMWRERGALVLLDYHNGAPLHLSGAQAVLYEVQHRKCYICAKSAPARALTIDHVAPRARGGYPGPGNILLAHATCNLRKGAWPPTPDELATLRNINLVLGWDRDSRSSPTQWRPAEYVDPRRVAIQRSLDRLAAVSAAKPSPTPRRRWAPMLSATEEAVDEEPDWDDLLPNPVSRDDSAMHQKWLAADGVLRSNRDMRHLGVQARAINKVKAKSTGNIRKRVRRRGNS